MAVTTYVDGKKEVRYEGCVINYFERNGYEDSDFFAECWDEEKGKVVTIMYDTTRFGGAGSAEIDATEETLRKVYRFYFNEARTMFDTRTNQMQAQTAKIGDHLKVVRGVKVPKGTEGRCFWKGTRYNYYSRKDEERVGLEVDGERLFVPAEYVQVMNWEQKLITGKMRKDIIRKDAMKCMPFWFRQIANKYKARRA